MSSFGNTDERGMIELIRKVVSREGCSDSLEDDAAVICRPDGDLVVSTDTVSFDRHKPDGMTFEQFGWMAAAVNMSDIASMGARPIGLLAALSLPESLSEQDVCDIMSGMDQCAEFCGTYIIGGDTKPGNGNIAGTALGSMDGRTPMRRKGAKDGDIIAVTGPLGSPAAGFRALELGEDLPDAVFSLYMPIPRVEEGIALSSTGKVTSCIDLSDGLSTAVNTLCSANGLGATIEWDLLPRGPGVKEIHEKHGVPEKNMLMDWGGEYELLFTFNKNDIGIINDTEVNFHMIGIMTEGGGPLLHRNEKYEMIENGNY